MCIIDFVGGVAVDKFLIKNQGYQNENQKQKSDR